MAGARVLTAAVFAGVVLLCAAPAQAGDAIRMAVKKPGGPYSDAVLLNLDPGETKSVKVRATNLTLSTQDATLFGDRFADHPERLKPKWFRGKQNITKAVKQGGYDFELAADSSKTFRVKVKATGKVEGCVRSEGTAGGSDSTAFIAVNDAGGCTE